MREMAEFQRFNFTILPIYTGYSIRKTYYQAFFIYNFVFVEHTEKKHTHELFCGKKIYIFLSIPSLPSALHKIPLSTDEVCRVGSSQHWRLEDKLGNNIHMRSRLIVFRTKSLTGNSGSMRRQNMRYEAFIYRALCAPTHQETPSQHLLIR